VLRGLLLRRQSDSSIRIFVDLAALFHFSCEFYQRSPPGIAQAQGRSDLTKAQWFAGSRQLRQNIGFGNGRAGLIGAWHGGSHCKRFARKRRRKYDFEQAGPFPASGTDCVHF
jgi:hypothetical protein